MLNPLYLGFLFSWVMLFIFISLSLYLLHGLYTASPKPKECSSHALIPSAFLLSLILPVIPVASIALTHECTSGLSGLLPSSGEGEEGQPPVG